MSLDEPGVMYDAAKAPDLKDIPVFAGCEPDAMLWPEQEQALKSHTTTPNLTPVLTRAGYLYRTTWITGVPISHKREVQVHVHHQLGIKGCLAAYELVGPTWQLNFVNVHVLLADAADTFLELLMVACRQLAMIGTAIIIAGLNSPPTMEDRGGGPTPEDTAVKVAMHHQVSAGPHSLPAGPTLKQSLTARPDKFQHGPVLRGPCTCRGDADAVPQPAIQSHRTPPTGSTG